MAEQKFDVVIAGGGVMGCSAAYWLSRMDPSLRMVVVEPDPSYRTASTALSVASIRQQFTTPINVRISAFGIDFIRNFHDHVGAEAGDLGFRENGYLFLAGSDTSAAIMRDVAAMQTAEGAATQLLDKSALASTFPYLSLDDVTLGSFGPKNEGWFDNMGLLQGFKIAAKRAGVVFVKDRVAGLTQASGKATGVTLATGTVLSAPVVVNAMGTRASDLLKSAGFNLPVEPRKRTVFVVDAPNARHPDAPLLVDHTGFYMRPEHNHWITATVPDDDGPADPNDFDPDLHIFEDLLWERLYHRCEGFDAVKLIRAWAGHYAYNTLDQNAIVGAWPDLTGLFLMNGFSGHGLQQSPAMGRGVAELILHGAYQTLDMSDLGPERIIAGKPFLEQAVV